ncbi:MULTISPECIES: ABC transporter ATP-binding protein [unclassified Gilliamella]|uniref:ABC transporter ATP-binding protein n=1 Tax=unclassified Gilliamella TaxID=2685620 RepID=UPI00130C627F|nr:MULTISPECIES: ABC transporter ATP-binding protein [unclassified Gilliamella]MWP48699.1 ATP-binding cassette domain-containing protein [Gilliamella sp. Lep-s35]MWP68484.1 ATP-binding cassette domain-containing protein [Gilliamella sp. Lep-s5]MWP76970.1 ATP-binding cassette domain-containing protein [Gilliamella sp. Lep-s21]
MSDTLLQVNNLTVTLDNSKPLLNNISFHLKHHQCLGIVGESGSGKSLTCKAIMGLLEPYFSVQGQILFSPKKTQIKLQQNGDLLKQNNETLRFMRGNVISAILQHPMSAFDPLYCVGNQVVETLLAHQPISKNQAITKTLNMLADIGLDNPKQIYNRYPHQLSGGMLQRIMIGIALMLEPELIIADEPTTALDSISQFHILKIFEQIKQQSKTSMIFISHDLGVIHHIADHILVMNKGTIVEQGSRDHIFYHSKNDYTQYLINARKQLLAKFNCVVQPNYITPSSETI